LIPFVCVVLHTLLPTLLHTHSHTGIIHNVERPEDEHYKALVSDLAERYMRRPGVVIVATITCTADIDTQVSGAGGNNAGALTAAAVCAQLA
jgi:hypothetical protein